MDAATQADGQPRPPAAVDRITVSLIRQARLDLDRLKERTGLSITDVVNRAISLYEFIDAATRTGGDLLVRDQKTRETQLVRLL
jgi:hypothetical protein